MTPAVDVAPASQPLREAATILLLRPTEDAEQPGVEVLTLTRSDRLVFSAGATAFPGGRVEESDASLQHAAVRETFEETGLLLAVRENGTPASEEIEGLPEGIQAQIEGDAALFTPFLTQWGLSPDVSRMHAISRWITPEGEPRRYDTHFFVAAVPSGQEIRELSGESVSWQWLSPQQALNEFRAGRCFLMPPTWSQLRLLSQATTVNEALQLPSQDQPVTPRVEPGPTRHVVDFPDHEAYAADLEQFHASRPRPSIADW